MIPVGEEIRSARLVGAVPPVMLRTAANPGGTPTEAVGAAIRARVAPDRSRYVIDLASGGAVKGSTRGGSGIRPAKAWQARIVSKQGVKEGAVIGWEEKKGRVEGKFPSLPPGPKEGAH